MEGSEKGAEYRLKWEDRMAHRRSFYLYKRHKKHGDYWYVCFLDRETGRQMSARSIDSLKERLGIMDFTHTERREDAAIIAQKALDTGLVISGRGDVLFSDWCLKFWDWDKSEYIALRNRLKPNSIGREYAYNMQRNFSKNVLPLLPEGLKLSKVSVKTLDNVSKALYASGKAAGTVKIIHYSFSLPLKEAERLGLIPSNPAERLLSASASKGKRGVLTEEEIRRLVIHLKVHSSLDVSLRLAILLALSTGMRLSEVRAVNVSDFSNSEVEGYEKLLIRHSIGFLSGVKGTKGKYERSVLIDKAFAREMKENAREGIVFPSPRTKTRYLSSPTLRNAFYRTLEEVGIGEDERKRRHITFHSIRHTFSSISRDKGISQEDRMVVMGHKSEEVNDIYTHSSTVVLERIAAVSSFILNAGKSAEISEKGKV